MMNREEAQAVAEARVEQGYHEPDDPMTEKMIADSTSDERALAIRRLADARARVIDMDDLRLAFGVTAEVA